MIVSNGIAFIISNAFFSYSNTYIFISIFLKKYDRTYDHKIVKISKNYGRNFKKVTLKKCARLLNKSQEVFIYKGF